MKWNNPGHEFDEKGRFFQDATLFIWGTGGEAADLFVRLKKLGLSCKVVSDDTQWRYGWCGTETLFSHQVLCDPNNKVIVVCDQTDQGIVFTQLINKGYEREKTCFSYYEFINKWLSVYAVYNNGSVYFKDISFLPTTKCNLQCDACLAFIPYIKEKKDEPIEKLKLEVDVFFTKIDYIGLFHVCGGEPVLYPYLDELLKYIDVNYRKKIHLLATTTNGTIPFSDAICNVLREHEVLLICDDYTDALPQYAQRLDSLVEQLNKNGNWYLVNKAEKWIDLTPTTTDNTYMSDLELQDHMKECMVPFSDYYNGRLYSCNFASYAEKANLCKNGPDDSYDLAFWNDEKKKELVEFRLGYTKRGYTEFCKKCAGFTNNPYCRKPATQLPR